MIDIAVMSMWVVDQGSCSPNYDHLALIASSKNSSLNNGQQTGFK